MSREPDGWAKYDRLVRRLVGSAECYPMCVETTAQNRIALDAHVCAMLRATPAEPSEALRLLEQINLKLHQWEQGHTQSALVLSELKDMTDAALLRQSAAPASEGAR